MAEKPLSPVHRYGGKSSLVNWIGPMLPECWHFVEPFAGGAVMLLNRAPSPIETLNDIDHEIVRFFRVLREQPDEFIRQATLMPYAEAEYRADQPEGELERALWFFFRNRGSVMGAEGGFAISHKALRHGMGAQVSKWLRAVETLPQAVERLRSVQILNGPALDAIRRCDSPDTLFYCDPPYPLDTRVAPDVYRHEMTDEQHVELAELLRSVQGKVAISSHDCELYDRLYEGWQKHTRATVTRGGRGGRRRVEAVWTNYDIAAGRLL